MSTNSNHALNQAVRKLNQTLGYNPESGRYRLVRRTEPMHGVSRAATFCLEKMEGQLARNISGWRTRSQMLAFVAGYQVGIEDIGRRLSRGDRTATRTVFGLEQGR